MKILFLLFLIFPCFLNGQELTESQNFNSESIFEASRAFPIDHKMYSVGIGILNSINTEAVGYTPDVVGFFLSVDKMEKGNFSIGFKGAYNGYTNAEFDYDARLVTLALRSNYHFNLLEQLDTYVGISGALRLSQIGYDIENSAVKGTFLARPIIGARYFIGEIAGLQVEYSPESGNQITVGLSIRQI